MKTWIKFGFNILLLLIVVATECFPAGGSCSICNVMAGLKRNAGLKRPGTLPQISQNVTNTEMTQINLQ